MAARPFRLRRLWQDLPAAPAGVYPLALLLAKAEVLETVGLWEAAGAMLRSCRDVVAAAGLRLETGIARYCLAKLTAKQGHLSAALELAEQARQSFEECGDREWLAKACNVTGLLSYYRGDLAPARERLERSLALAGAGGYEGSRMIALGNLGMIYTDLGDYDRAFGCHREQLAYAEATGDLHLAALAASNLGYLYDWRGDHDRAGKFHQQQLALFLRMGDKWGLITAYNNIGVHEMEVREYALAREHMERSLQLCRELNEQQSLSLALVNLGKIKFEQGEIDAAIEDLHQADRIARGVDNYYVQAQARGILGSVLAFQGKYQPAEENLRQAVALFSERSQQNYLCDFQLELADLYCRMGRHDEARELLRQALALAAALDKRHALFLGQVLEAKLVAAGDAPAARRALEGLLEGEQDDERRALLHYELFRLTREQGHRASGLALLAAIHARTPSIGVGRMLDEMTKG